MGLLKRWATRYSSPMNENNVPKWFSDFQTEFTRFAVANEKAHGELSAKIQEEFKSHTRWTFSLIISSSVVIIAVLSGVMLMLG